MTTQDTTHEFDYIEFDDNSNDKDVIVYYKEYILKDFKSLLNILKDTVDNEYKRYCLNQEIDYSNNDMKIMFSIKNNEVEFIAKKENDVFYTYNKVFECKNNDCIEIKFNYKIISNIIEYKCEKIKFTMQDHKSPILCYFDNNKANKYVAMPLIIY